MEEGEEGEEEGRCFCAEKHLVYTIALPFVNTIAQVFHTCGIAAVSVAR
jgi:hypothetical protein